MFYYDFDLGKEFKKYFIKFNSKVIITDYNKIMKQKYR